MILYLIDFNKQMCRSLQIMGPINGSDVRDEDRTTQLFPIYQHRRSGGYIQVNHPHDGKAFVEEVDLRHQMSIILTQMWDVHLRDPLPSVRNP